MLNLLDHIVARIPCPRCRFRFRLSFEQMRTPGPLRCPACNERLPVGVGLGQLENLAAAWRVVQHRLEQLDAEVSLRP